MKKLIGNVIKDNMEFKEEIFESLNLFQQVVIELDNKKEISIKNLKQKEKDIDKLVIIGIGQNNKISNNIEKVVDLVLKFINKRKFEIVSVI